MVRSALDAWPGRRRFALAALLPVVTAWFVSLGHGGPVPLSVAWYGVALLASVLGAAVLAGYVPVAGRGLDLGCTPCAAMSALTLVGASMALRNYGADLAGPLVASALLLFGLSQRMSQSATCATTLPSSRRTAGKEAVREGR